MDYNRIQAEMTIQLEHKVEAKKEDEKSISRFYRFSIPVGVPFEEALAYAKEMVAQVEAMKKKSEELKEKEEKESDKKKDKEKK